MRAGAEPAPVERSERPTDHRRGLDLLGNQVASASDRITMATTILVRAGRYALSNGVRTEQVLWHPKNRLITSPGSAGEMSALPVVARRLHRSAGMGHELHDRRHSPPHAQPLMQWLAGERRESEPPAARLYQKVYARLYAGLGRSASDAEDATQATFLEAIKNRERIRQGLPEYVAGVGRMKLREHYRRRARRERTISMADLDALPSARADAALAVEAVLEVGLLVSALERLTPADQRCLALVYGRELRNVEAAAALGVPKVVFDNRIGHARARLRRLLEGIGPTGDGRPRSCRSFQQWVASVLGPPGHDGSSGSPSGNRSL